MDHVSPGEEGLAQQDLREYTPDAPDVDGRGILGEEASTQLRGPVPTGSHVIGPVNGGGHIRKGRTGQAEIADLQLAVGIGQDILGFQIPVENLGCWS